MRPVIYQLFVRHFSNMEIHGVDWGSREENGCGTFNGVTDKALREIARMGFTHIWLTGVLRHATQTAHPGLPAQPESIVKGLAGSPYTVLDYFDVDPDLGSVPELRMEEFKALVRRCRTVGLVPLMDFVPNHVSRAYLADWDGHDDFGEGDDHHTFFSPEQGYFYLTSNSPGDGPPLRLPDGLFEGEMTFGRVTGNNAVTWEPDRCDWYETVKLNYGYNFLAGLPALRLLPDWTSPKQKVPKTWRIMDDILSFWQGLGIGGFRCDMAQMIPMAFWKWAIARSRVRLPDVFFMAEAYNDHLKTTPGDPCTALLESGFNAVYDADCYHLAEHVYTRGNWANDFDRLFRSEPQYLTHGVRYVENHDEKRVCSPIAWGGTGRTILPAIMTLVYASGKGPVLVYNGQEVGERAEAPGGFGGHNGRTSIFDYTCLPQLQPWVAGGRFDASLLDEDSAELRDFHARLLPLLQHPALDRGDFYGLNWANMKNTTFGREPAEDTSGHWVYAMLRYHAHAHSTVLVVGNLSPTINFYNLRISIPQHAFNWCGIQTAKVRARNLMKKDGKDRFFDRSELMERGLPYPLKPGEVGVLELSGA